MACLPETQSNGSTHLVPDPQKLQAKVKDFP
jgi:hypothetical protein